MYGYAPVCLALIATCSHFLCANVDFSTPKIAMFITQFVLSIT